LHLLELFLDGFDFVEVGADRGEFAVDGGEGFGEDGGVGEAGLEGFERGVEGREETEGGGGFEGQVLGQWEEEEGVLGLEGQEGLALDFGGGGQDEGGLGGEEVEEERERVGG
jgi:hypothetical protein